VILTKAEPSESNTGYAQGGIAAAIGADDSPELHAPDTTAAGDGFCASEAVDRLVREVERTGSPVHLTLAHLDPRFVSRRFPTLARVCAGAGFDLARDRIPVSPAAHDLMGGVVTDLDARTSIPGLFAAGEVACTGLHGANRLASNSLLEGLVFGARAAAAMAAPPQPAALPDADVRDVSLPAGVPGAVPTAGEVRDLMWRSVGLLRTRTGTRGSVGAARRRQERRGAHFRTDFPARDDLHWRKHISDRLWA
jgi:L-aspartate oxidase